VAGKTAPASSRRSVTPEVYNAFIAGVDLVSIRLVRAQIEAASTPTRKQIVPTTRVHGASFTNEDGQVSLVHRLGFTGTYQGEDEPAVSIRVDFEVRYSTVERMTDEIFAEFRRRNLPLNTWPYFREFVHAALARTGWPVMVLPVYKASGTPLSPARKQAEPRKAK
jgi:hypothetical protein